MLVSRIQSSLAVLDNEIYVISGLSSNLTLTRECEKFHLQTRTWKKISSCTEYKDGTMAAIDAANRFIYVAGGHCGPQLTYSSSIEKYRVDADTWTPMQL